MKRNHSTRWFLSARDILGVFIFYAFFSFIYHLVLWYIGATDDQLTLLGWADIRMYWFYSGMQYALYLVGSILIWLLAIRLYPDKSRFAQVFIVVLSIPFAVWLARDIRYAIVDRLGMFRLEGKGMIWDIYIPTLFFLVQFGFYFAYVYFQENQRKLAAEAELKQAALQSQLLAIKAQINPHFLYNTFNTINASIPAEHEHTRELISKLADLFRYQLRATKEDFIPIREEIDFIEKYLELEKVRFEERLNVIIEVHPELWNQKIPPMILQPLVENSLKHGLSSLVEGGTITIKISKLERNMQFEIADDGIGVADKVSIMSRGVGLRNTQLRLEKHYGAALELLDNEPKGLKIVFQI